MSKNIVVIDYGMGNLHSVTNALEFIGAKNTLSTSISDLETADAIILPGVGAFPDASDRLYESGYADKIISLSKQGMPLLGICLGMQLLLNSSDEVRFSRGLGLIEGHCERIADTGLKIPHIGWNDLTVDDKSCPILKNTKDGECVYFVHSYKAVLKNRENLAAHTVYGEEIPAVIQNANVFGAQFHPEKSQNTGLEMLRAFCDFAGIEHTGR